MQEKLKKQRFNITLKISCVLLSVWIIVSVIFFAITINVEKQTQITKQSREFDSMVDRMSSMPTNSYNNLCKFAQITKTHTDKLTTKELVPQIESGADGTFDKDLQVVLFAYPTDRKRNKEIIFDTDNDLYLYFKATTGEVRYDGSGTIDYNDFVNSISQDDLNTIIKYLNVKKDKNGYYYALMCTKTYYNSKSGHLIPKTVELVKTHDDHSWYAEDEVIKTFELSPKGVESFKLHTLARDARCVINGQFVCNDFASEGLIKDPYKSINYYSYDPGNYSYDPTAGIVEKKGPFTYLYTNGETFTIETLGYEVSNLMRSYNSTESAFYEEQNSTSSNNSYANSVGYIKSDIGVRYAKQINLLHCARNTLIIGIAALFVFFLIIGIILYIMMWKLMKTELIEEEKLKETTNALAHDLKTPLFIISGYAQNLKENTSPEKREHYINRIIERTNEVNSLVHKMLDFSRLSKVDRTLDLKNTNISQIIKKAIADYDALPRNKTIILELDAKCEALVDETLFYRAATYLIDNAIKYSDEESEIDITLTDKTLCVSNKCSTITKDDIKHITEPYYRVEKSRESDGNGLGLSIVKSIVDMHNFDLDIKLIDEIISFTVVFHK